MTHTDAKLIQGIEDKLKELKLDPEEEDKKRRTWYKSFGIVQSGFKSQDLELPEGAIIIGVSKGELRNAVAREGYLWIGDESFPSLSSAAAKATNNPTQYGWSFWTMVHIPKKGFMELKELRETEVRPYNSRKQL